MEQPTRAVAYQLIYSRSKDGRTSTTPIGIRCVTCGMTSYNLNDVRERYCGHCHRFLDEN